MALISDVNDDFIRIANTLEKSNVQSKRIGKEVKNSLLIQESLLKQQGLFNNYQIDLYERSKKLQYPLENIEISSEIILYDTIFLKRILELCNQDLAKRGKNPNINSFYIDSLDINYFLSKNKNGDVYVSRFRIGTFSSDSPDIYGYEKFRKLHMRIRFQDIFLDYASVEKNYLFSIDGYTNMLIITGNFPNPKDHFHEHWDLNLFFKCREADINLHKRQGLLSLYDLKDKHLIIDVLDTQFEVRNMSFISISVEIGKNYKNEIELKSSNFEKKYYSRRKNPTVTYFHYYLNAEKVEIEPLNPFVID